MFSSLIMFATELLSGGASWMPHGVSEPPLRAGNILITPYEPSTLTLALIGIVTIAIYAAATGWRLPRRNTAQTSDVPTLGAVPYQSSANAEEILSRGAA